MNKLAGSATTIKTRMASDKAMVAPAASNAQPQAEGLENAAPTVVWKTSMTAAAARSEVHARNAVLVRVRGALPDVRWFDCGICSSAVTLSLIETSQCSARRDRNKGGSGRYTVQ